ncbi:diguanylate cyclase domain-containing protein [Chitinilyticum litopenaei]|uniref:diguanylate cyclase domain-containing protein n=1 Tax=Chitinilyticum litopenaei TaxID=1121276 RepID=UPI000407C8F0|nr:diguanylate cyclase [Chitinilyticum litopenaei]
MPADHNVLQLLHKAKVATRGGAAKKAVRLVDQAAALLSEDPDPALEAAIELERARIAWGLVKYSEGLQHLRKVLNLSDDAPLLRAEALSLQALLHNALGNYSKALEGWILCLEEAGTSGNPELYIEAYLGIGHYYLIDRQPAKAQLYHRYAYHLGTQHSDLQLRLKAALYLLFDLVQAGQSEEALDVLAVAQASQDENTDPAWRAETLHYAAAIYLEQARLAEAETALQASLKINMDAMLLWGETQNRMLLARLYEAQGKLAQAGSTLETSIAIASSFDQGFLLQQISKQLVEVRERAGDHAAALAAHEAYHRFAVSHRRQLKQSRSQIPPAREAQLDLRLQLLKARYDLALLRQAASQHDGADLPEDALTGLPARATLEATLQERQNHTPQTLLYWRLHGLTLFNEQHGKASGNRVLQRCASLLLQAARQFHGHAMRLHGSGLLLVIDRGEAAPALLRLQEWLPHLHREYTADSIVHSLALLDADGLDKPAQQILLQPPAWRWPADGKGSAA